MKWRSPSTLDQAHRESVELYSSLVLMTRNRYSRTRKNDRKPLKVFQANVGKIPPAPDCTLAPADSERYDIVLLQEPWTAHTKVRCLTKTHLAYDTFTPAEVWDSNETRPRVMTYVGRDPRLLADQIRPFETCDILWITVNDMTIVNFYRQNDGKDALSTLLGWSVTERCLVAGDLDARHRSWQSGQITDRGQEIAAWASENDLDLLNTPDIPTNPHGNTIDLAFTNLLRTGAVAPTCRLALSAASGIFSRGLRRISREIQPGLLLQPTQSSDYIFYCRKVPPRHQTRLAPSPNAAVNLAIGRDLTKFVDLYKNSAFFGKIFPYY